jgi:hypothetical protein
MTETKILATLLAVVAGLSGVAIVSTLAYLRKLREEIRRHRDLRRRVNEASKSGNLFEEQHSHSH